MKIYLEPNPKQPDKCDGGIRRVIDAQLKYLPEFGITVTRKMDKADLTVGHVDHAPIVKDVPFVSHCHGLMWTEYFDEDGNREINQQVVGALLQAQAITVPSNWVKQALSYGMLRDLKVIYHGVDLDEWQLSENPGDYVLWNKARADAVSNPQDVIELARRMPQTKFFSTLGKPTANLKVLGITPYQQHKSLIQNALVYLATARETFGIGTLEALASGVPVAGWDYGGQSEIIRHGETGYLAPYGNYDALIHCVNLCVKERGRLSENARQDVIERWQWFDKIKQYADLYKSVVADWTKQRPKVSVIVPCHNLGKFLPDALKSVLTQTMQDWECIIVDDASTDYTPTIAQEAIKQSARFKYFKTPGNLKLSGALNYGHSLATGKYVMNLDADNVLPERALEILSDALDNRRDLHIVYGGLDTMSEDGTNRKPNAFPYPEFSWYGQIAHCNQLHSSAMMRKEVIEQSNGYRERQWRAEDAELWTRVSSFGFKIERVTSEPTLIYRWRQNSKSFQERQLDPNGIDGDWTKYFPWATAHSLQDGDKQWKLSQTGINNPELVPFAAMGKRIDRIFWDVKHRQEPLVSVIIPCGNGHRKFLNDAIDSIVGQLTNDWECVIVNDTDETWDNVQGAPFVRVIQNRTGKHGAGVAKNIGIDNAKGKLVFFLDADDMLEPQALAKMLQAYAKGQSSYIYSDVFVPESLLKNKTIAMPEYNQKLWQHNGLHTQAMLMATEDAKRIRFDEDLFAWEDWDFITRCAINGVCGERISEPLLLYRKHLGQRSNISDGQVKELKKILHDRYNDYATGAKEMSKCGGCAKKAQTAIQQSRVMTVSVKSSDAPLEPGFMRVKYIGGRQAPITFYANGHGYTFANTPKWAVQDVPLGDAERLLLIQGFIEVKRMLLEQPQPVKVEPIKVEPVKVEPVRVEPNPIVQKPDAPKLVSNDAMQQAIALMEKETKERIQPAMKQNDDTIGELGKQLLDAKTKEEKFSITKKMDEAFIADQKKNLEKTAVEPKRNRGKGKRK